MLATIFRRWWDIAPIDDSATENIDQAVLEHLHTHVVRVPYLFLVATAIMAMMIAQSVPWVWPALWFLAVALVQLVRAPLMVRTIEDTARPARERLARCVKWFLFSSTVFATIIVFFPFVSESVRFIFTILIIGLVVGGIASLQGYPPIFFSFAIPNIGAVILGWLFTTPEHSPVWVHYALAGLTFLLLLHLFGFSRYTYRAFATAQILNSDLQAALLRANEANEAKSKFFTAASHDLRQPLQSIGFLSHSIERSYSNPAEVKKLSVSINRCVSFLSNEIDTLLDISSLDTGQVTVRPQPIELTEVLQHVTDIYQPQAQAGGIKLSMVVNDRPIINADKVLLTRLLRNLVDNACKYTHHGDVTLTLSVVDGFAEIVVEDTGIGISVEHQARIFDEFHQVGNPQRDRRKGLGLGLSVVNRLLVLLNGSLSVESTIGVGSKFSVCFPLDRSRESLVPPCARSLRQFSHKALLIEDDEDVREATQLLLESWGFAVSTALDWASVEASLLQSLPDIVISDLRLPCESGLQIATRIRQHHHQMPVLLISGDHSSPLAVEAMSMGYVVLSKPVSVGGLNAEIASLLGQ